MSPAKIMEGQQLAAEYLEWISRPDRQARVGKEKKVSAAPATSNPPEKTRVGVVLTSTTGVSATTQAPAVTLRDQFIVQLGLFRNPNGIAKLERTLRGKGISFSKKAVTIRGRSYQQFRVGPFPRVDAAKKTARRIDKILHINSAVIPVPS